MNTNTTQHNTTQLNSTQPFWLKKFSIPNVVTIIRLLLSVVVMAFWFYTEDVRVLYIWLFIHRLGDVLDGFLARKFWWETILGAEIDIIADRISTLLFYIVLLNFYKNILLWVIVFLYVLNFCFVDIYLSYQFIKFPIISVNYFDKIDKIVYQLNFSKIWKFLNSGVVTLWIIFIWKYYEFLLIYVLVLLRIKIYSILRLRKQPVYHKLPFDNNK